VGGSGPGPGGSTGGTGVGRGSGGSTTGPGGAQTTTGGGGGGSSTGSLNISVTPASPGAAVLVDGTRANLQPSGAWLSIVSPGPHLITVSLAKYRTFQTTAMAVAGGVTQVAAVLKPATTLPAWATWPPTLSGWNALHVNIRTTWINFFEPGYGPSTLTLNPNANFTVVLTDQNGNAITDSPVLAQLYGILLSDPTQTPYLVGGGEATGTTDGTGTVSFNFGGATVSAQASYYLMIDSQGYGVSEEVPITPTDFTQGATFYFTVNTATGEAGNAVQWTGTISVLVNQNGIAQPGKWIAVAMADAAGNPLGSGNGGVAGTYQGATNSGGIFSFSLSFLLNPSSSYTAQVPVSNGQTITVTISGATFAGETTVSLTVDIGTGSGSVQ
jgi:hypothetical protein